MFQKKLLRTMVLVVGIMVAFSIMGCKHDNYSDSSNNQPQQPSYQLDFTPIGNGYRVSCHYLNADVAIVIPAEYNGKPVTHIGSFPGNYDYSYNSFRLTGITIPNSITTIEGYAFSNCRSLTSITIPNSVTSIEYSAFNNCASLTSITIPNGVSIIGTNPFQGCANLASINVENGNIIYRSEGNCIIRRHDNALISGCKNSVIPASVTSIDNYAFCGIGLTSITIPVSVASIDRNAFYNCASLVSITVQSGNTAYRSEGNCLINIYNTLILGCKNSIISASVTHIGDSAFSYCTGLINITVPSSVTSIGSSAFYDCTGLINVTFNGSISSGSFSNGSFPGDLRDKYLTGGIGTYTRASGSDAWTKQ